MTTSWNAVSTATAKTMTKRFLLSAGVSLLLLLAATPVTAQLLDRVVAIVGDDVIALSELRKEAQDTFVRLAQANIRPMPSKAQIIERALDGLINHKLQVAEAKRLGIDVDGQTMAQALQNIAARNGITLGQLREALTREGVNFDAFREGIKEKLLISRLINREVVNKIQISKSEVDQYLAQNARLSGRKSVNMLHILISTPDGSSPEQLQQAREQAENIKQRVINGEDFRVLAQNESDGRQSLEGGYLGWLSIDQIPTLFLDAAMTLEKGETHGPIRSASGFHLIQMVDFRGDDRKLVRQTKARHILIRTNELTADADAKSRLQKLQLRIENGDDFAALARSNSDDTASAISGGDLDWINPGQMVDEFEEQMNLLDPGQVSAPFKTRFGWHIVQVLDRRAHDATEETRRHEARVAIRKRKATDAEERYVRRLRDEAFIELRLEDDS